MKQNPAAMDMDITQFQAVNSFIATAEIDGRTALRVIKDPRVTEFDEATYARLAGSEFHNGTLTVQVLSRLLPDAPEFARGFIGLAFRIGEKNSQFEGLYIRPTNGRAEDSFRRSHATQYFSYPDYKFDRLRNEAPGKYESGADIGLNEWIRLKIVVKGEQARLFINEGQQPVLVVEDLKHGPHASGGIGLWVEVGTEGFFRDLVIEKD